MLEKNADLRREQALNLVHSFVVTENPSLLIFLLLCQFLHQDVRLLEHSDSVQMTIVILKDCKILISGLTAKK